MYGPAGWTFVVGQPNTTMRSTRTFEKGLIYDPKRGSLAPHLAGALEIRSCWSRDHDSCIRRVGFRFCRNVWSERAIPPEHLEDLPQGALPGDSPADLVDTWAFWRDGKALPQET